MLWKIYFFIIQRQLKKTAFKNWVAMWRGVSRDSFMLLSNYGKKQKMGKCTNEELNGFFI